MIVPLNIVTTYPVRWTKYKVFRDFVQNFYDSVGYLQWEKDFIMRNAGLWMDTQNVIRKLGTFCN